MHYWQIVISDKQFLSFKWQAIFCNRKANKSWSQLTTLQVVGSQAKGLNVIWQILQLLSGKGQTSTTLQSYPSPKGHNEKNKSDKPF